MKYLQRYLSLLFALVMCVGLFSVTVHAEHITDLTLSYQSNLYLEGGQKYFAYTLNDRVNNDNFLLSSPTVNMPMTAKVIMENRISFQRSDGSLIARKGETFNISIQNICNIITVGGTIYPWKNGADNVYNIALVHTDGSYSYFYNIDWNYSSGNMVHFVSVDVTASKDVRKIIYYECTNQQSQTGLPGGYYNVDYTFGSYDSILGIVVDIETKETGLLKSIVSKLTSGFSDMVSNLKSGFNDTVDNLKSGFNSVVDSIVNLPAKLWELISNGLKSLFVPSEESMTAYKDKWDELLASRFGAVYQVVNIMTDSWDGIMQADQTDTIEFPQASINLSGTPFTFGGYSVKIVPDGFGVLVTAIKTIVAIVCTVAFVNGMRKRYDEIMEVEQ